MRNNLLKIGLAATCLAMLSMPLFAQKGKPNGGNGGGGGGGGCAVVFTPRLSTDTAAPGTNVGVFGKVSNCTSSKKRYTVTATSVSSCGEETVIGSSLISFAGGETKGISIAFPVPPDTCLGMSTVTVSAYESGNMLGTGAAYLTIQ